MPQSTHCATHPKSTPSKEKTAAHPGQGWRRQISGPLISYLSRGRQNPAEIDDKTGRSLTHTWDRTRQYRSKGRQAGQIIPGKESPTNSITRSATAPNASAMIVSCERVIADLISLAIGLLLRSALCCRFVLIWLTACKELFKNICEQNVPAQSNPLKLNELLYPVP